MLQPVLPWNRWTPWARFEMFGCLQVSGVHVAQTPLKTIIVTDRTDRSNTVIKLPNGQSAFAEELTFNGDPMTAYNHRALDVKSNTFCSSGQFLPNGTLLNIGGTSVANAKSTILLGATSIRAFSPCTDNTCDFTLVANLTRKRWYPTTQMMADGRVLIVGGADTFGALTINTYQLNNPTVEYFPRMPGEGSYYLSFLDSTLPFNLYPFLNLLPSGLVFMFAQTSWILFDPKTNQEVPGVYPELDKIDEMTGFPWVRSSPNSGVSAMFPLKSSDGYRAEIMICGGQHTAAVTVVGNLTATGRNSYYDADYRCWRIFPEDPSPTWTQETMCDWPACKTRFRRVLGDMVLLADGSVFIGGGVQQGFSGLVQQTQHKPQLQPLIYLTHNHSWYPWSQLPASAVPRAYHSSALLLHDATVLITGSNPNNNLVQTGLFPTEFRAEKFIPPYLLTGRARPVITQAPASLVVNTTFQVSFNAPQPGELTASRFSVTLLNQGFSTHGDRHGMRNVVLDILAIQMVSDNAYVASIMAPPTLNHAPPGVYWLHVLDAGVPNKEGASIRIG